MYKINFKKFENTDKFRPAAIYFEKYGEYTSAPRGTTAYREYWEQETDRCLNGYTAEDGERITGYNYWYLNYCVIIRMVDVETISKDGTVSVKQKRERAFPRFYDFDKYFFDTIEQCEIEGRHLAVLKARRKGYSYKIASMLDRNYFLIPDSKGFALASKSEFLVRDGILSKAWEMMDFIDENTAWGKKRQKIDTRLHKRASLVIDKGDGIKTEIGYKSEIIGVTLGNDYNAARGKCFGKGTKVLMYDGNLKEVEKLELGDLLMGPDSCPRKILELHSGIDKLYNIIPRNGIIQTVNSKHDIYTYSQVKGHEGYKLLTPEAFINLNETTKRYYNLEKVSVNFKEKELLLDPYFLGLWLGDGSLRKSELTTADFEIITYLQEFCNSNNLRLNLLTKKHKNNKAKECIISGRFGYLRKLLKEIKVFDHKHIPFEYLNNSTENRLKLLAGLVDTDGYYDKKYKRIEIVQKSKRLTDDIVYLCRSLGFKTTVNKKYLKEYGVYYRIFLFNDLHRIPTLIKRKQAEIYVKQQLNSFHSKFTIEYKGIGEYYGFTVDKDNLFLLEDFTICHNSGKLMIFEEAGSFKHLKAAWQVARPSVEQGSNVHGLMIAFGTGGTDAEDFESLKDLFNEPNAYNCLEIENVWEETGVVQPGGFFVPYTANLDGKDESGNDLFMDKDGNSLISKCKEFVLKKRQEVIDNASDRTAIDRHVAENCLTPAEATLNISTNIFPKEELLKHLANIRNSTKLKEMKQVGDLVFDGTGKVVWVPTSNPMDLLKYRLRPDEKTKGRMKGQIVIWEHPIDNPPYALYVAGIDPYDHDKSTTDSLLSVFIYKRFSSISETGRIIVAEYTGRPDFAEEAYEEVRKLLLYYNATGLYENQCKGMFPYFASKHSEYLLADQPDIIRDIVKNTNVSRGKGIHMPKEIKIWGEGKIKEWLTEELSPGVLKLTTIMSEPLIEELIAYNDKGNFDRVIAFMLCLIYEEELFRIIVKKHKKDVNDRMIFKEPLFQQTNFKF